MIISSRSIKGYIGVSYNEPTPYPANWLIPENSDPTKYDGIPDPLTCPKCKTLLLLGNPDNVDNSSVNNYNCPICNGRYSLRTRDKAWTNIGMNPATLNTDMGSNTNNAQMGIMYHPEPYANQDTFSGNLGK